MSLTERFNLSVGLRLEVPTYPSISSYNRNQEFEAGWNKVDENGNIIAHHALADGDNSISGLSTTDMPEARMNFSPRIGFNWDLMGDRSLILRGGSGFYTGRLPFVWIVSTVGNSNCMQNQFITTNEDVTFATSPDAIIAANSDKLTVGDLPAPQSPTIMDKDLKMPQTWKSSLALDAKLPGGIKATLEGIYNKDITSVAVTKLGIKKDGSIQLPGEPGERDNWVSEHLINSLGKDVTPYYITNSDNKGYYYSGTAQLSKDFDCGLNLMAAYTYSNGKNVIDGIGDQVTSAFNTNTFGVNGSNSQELGYSSYVSPNRILLNVGWTWPSGKRTTETIGLYYEGFNHCYIGGFSYTRYSYTMASNVNGDGGANSLAYIPTETQLFDGSMPFVSEENAAAFNQFIKEDKYLNDHRGEYAERGGAIAPWRHTFNFKYERTIKFNGGEKLSFGIDVNNIANLIYRGWGNMQRLNSSDILKYSKDAEGNYQYEFTSPTWSEYASTYSTWSAALNVRLSF